MRQIFLDTETTGLSPQQGHRIVEIAAIEMVDGALTENSIHFYTNPNREIDSFAQEVHGLTLDFLESKPSFSDVADDVVAFIEGAELIAHNAPFDVGFLNAEFALLRLASVESVVNKVTDTLTLAKALRPGQRNDLDTLCRDFGINHSSRILHGARIDAQLLAEVYMVMLKK